MATKAYRTKSKKLAGSNYGEVHRKAFGLYIQIKKRSKRRVYIRSAYFHKDKIFLSLFWHHLNDKHHKERLRRFKYFHCAVELIRDSRFDPTSMENADKKGEKAFRQMEPYKPRPKALTYKLYQKQIDLCKLKPSIPKPSCERNQTIGPNEFYFLEPLL